MANPLKFISDLETRAKNLSGDRVRLSFDALDEMRTENARLRRELIEAREEAKQLRNQLEQRTSISSPIPVVKVPVIEASKEEPSKPETTLTDAAIRFSLLELD